MVALVTPGTGVTEEQHNAGVLALMTGVASGVDGDACGPGSTLPISMLLPLPVLRFGCVKGAGGVGQLISTELCYEGGNLTSRGLLAGWAGIWLGLSCGKGSKQALGVAPRFSPALVPSWAEMGEAHHVCDGLPEW